MSLVPQQPLFQLDVGVETDGRIVIARSGPLDADPLRALARQADLAAPAKVSLSGDGACELRAEVMRVGGLDAAKHARGALDVARAWLAEESPATGEAPPDAESLESALAELPRAWAWEETRSSTPHRS